MHAVQDYRELWETIEKTINKDDYEDFEQFYSDHFERYLSIFEEVLITHQSSGLFSVARQNTSISEWIIGNEWNDEAIKKDIFENADKYKTASAENKILRAEDILTLDDDVLQEGWENLINSFDEGKMGSSDFSTSLYIQSECIMMGIQLPQYFDDARVQNFSDKNDSYEAYWMISEYIYTRKDGEVINIDDGCFNTILAKHELLGSVYTRLC